MKIILVGDNTEAKKVFRENHTGILLSTKYKFNIGAKITYKELEIAGKIIIFTTWDLETQQQSNEDRYTTFYRYSPYFGSLGAIVVYDTNEISSLESLDYWINEIWANSMGKIPIAIYAHVEDKNKRKISTKIGLKAIENLAGQSYPKIISYTEGSVYEGENVNNPYEFLGQSFFSYLKDSPMLKELISKGFNFN